MVSLTHPSTPKVYSIPRLYKPFNSPAGWDQHHRVSREKIHRPDFRDGTGRNRDRRRRGSRTRGGWRGKHSACQLWLAEKEDGLP